MNRPFKNVFSLFGDQMWEVPIVLAEILQQIRIDRGLLFQLDGPGLGVSLRVVFTDSEGTLQAIDVGAGSLLRTRRQLPRRGC